MPRWVTTPYPHPPHVVGEPPHTYFSWVTHTPFGATPTGHSLNSCITVHSVLLITPHTHCLRTALHTHRLPPACPFAAHTPALCLPPHLRTHTHLAPAHLPAFIFSAFFSLDLRHNRLRAAAATAIARRNNRHVTLAGVKREYRSGVKGKLKSMLPHVRQTPQMGRQAAASARRVTSGWAKKDGQASPVLAAISSSPDGDNGDDGNVGALACARLAANHKRYPTTTACHYYLTTAPADMPGRGWTNADGVFTVLRPRRRGLPAPPATCRQPGITGGSW